MSSNRYDTNNDIVRYQNTGTSLTLTEQKEDKRMIDMMYAFEEDISNSLSNLRYQKDINQNNNNNNNNYNDLFGSYFNSNFNSNNNNNQEIFKDDKDVDFSEISNEQQNDKDISNLVVFKKKIVSPENKNPIYETNYQKNKSTKILREKAEQKNNYKSSTNNEINCKFDLNKFKIEPPDQAKNQRNSIEDNNNYNKVIINNVNNNNNNNIIITSINKQSKDKDQKEDDDDNDDKDEDNPLTSSIIESIKTRNPIKAQNQLIESSNRELTYESQKLPAYENHPSVSTPIYKNNQNDFTRPRRKNSTDLPSNRKQREEYNIDYIPDYNLKSIHPNYNNNNNKINSFNISNDDIEMKYLTKLSKLKKENDEMKDEINKHNNEIKDLNEKFKLKVKECINYKSSYDTLQFEYDILEKKHNDLKDKYINNESLLSQLNELKNENKIKTNQIEELNSKIEKLEKEKKDLQSSSLDDQSGLREAKTSYESMKNNYDDIKRQYDLMVMKFQNLNEENFNLKRELLLYKGRSENFPKENSIDNNSIEETSTEIVHKGIQSNKVRTFALLKKNSNNSTESTEPITPQGKNYKYQNQSNFSFASENNEKAPINNNITQSRRKRISSISQNDSSGVGAILGYNDDIKQKETKKNPVIKAQFQNPYVSITQLPSHAQMIEKESQINQLERKIYLYQQERDKFTNEYNKFPEHPKQQSLILQKKNVAIEIENLNVKISNCRKELREINKSIY